MDLEVVGKAITSAGQGSRDPAVIEQAREMGVKLPPQLDDPHVELTGELIIEVLRDVSWHLFPGLAPDGESHRDGAI